MKLPDRLRDVGRRVAVAFVLENEDAVKEFVRSYMVARLEGHTPGQLAYAIANDTDLWANLPGRLRSYGKQVAGDAKVREVYRKYSGQVNSDLVMQWLQEDRPDLYGIVRNWGGPEAMGWLTRQTEKVKSELMPPEPILQARAPPAPQGAAPSQPQTTQGPPAAREVSQQDSRQSSAGTP